ncbi:DNA replication ATP-dependent helicase/nuclease DNA2-like protein [Cladobotryum mycophilum]|uniref:DNA replication ATP-dependent helicase/nuclease DNA2-like protein n=1 Tax=Cladobotryum mycophilum TaxID=491253 RepID=A0ABR0SZ06_9HYPO
METDEAEHSVNHSEWTAVQLPFIPYRDSASFKNPAPFIPRTYNAFLYYPEGRVIGGSHFGFSSNINVKLFWLSEARFGFSLCFPRSRDKANPLFYDLSTKKETKAHQINFIFRPDTFDLRHRGFTDDEFNRYPNLTTAVDGNDFLVVDITLKDGSEVEVEGFRSPYIGIDPTTSRIVNKDIPIQGFKSIPAIMAQRSFTLVVNSRSYVIPLFGFGGVTRPPISPYKTGPWDKKVFDDIIPANRGPQLPAKYKFNSLEGLVVTLGQSVVQDNYDIDCKAAKIAETKFPVAFIRAGHKDNGTIIIAAYIRIDPHFKAAHQPAWSRLVVPNDSVKVLIFDRDDEPCKIPGILASEATGKPKSITAMIMEDASLIPGHTKQGNFFFKFTLHRHQMKGDIRVFSSCQQAERAAHWPDSASHLVAEDGMEVYREPDIDDDFDGGYSLPPVDSRTYHLLRLRQSWFRDLMVGNGFAKTCRWPPVDEIPEYDGFDPSMTQFIQAVDSLGIHRYNKGPLPVYGVNYTTDIDDHLLDTIINRLFPRDQKRYRNYMSSVPMGLAVISGFAGSGKTETMALTVALLIFNPDIGRVYGSGPTNIAIDNLAERTCRVIGDIVSTYNSTKPSYAEPICRKIIIRGHELEREIRVFFRILYTHSIKNIWSVEDVGFKTQDFEALHPDDDVALHRLHEQWQSQPGLSRLLSLAQDEMTTEEYKSGKTVDSDIIRKLMQQILDLAHMVCTTPHISDDSPYKEWNGLKANAVAFDEAGALSRPDALLVWGNDFRPCVLAGDDRQLLPIVMTINDRDPKDSKRYLNRFGPDGQVSLLEFLKYTGWPVYSLEVQHRIVRGGFILALRNVYQDLADRFEYGETCAVKYHPIGEKVERYLNREYNIPLALDKDGNLEEIRPVFVHCRGTVCEFSKSKSLTNHGQISIMVSILEKMVTELELNTDDIVVIAPYRFLKKHTQEALDEHPTLYGITVDTADTFQGREAPIAIFLMGVTSQSGPGFVAHKNRLNVGVTRHQDQLIIIGDLSVLSTRSRYSDKTLAGMIKDLRDWKRVINVNWSGESDGIRVTK